MIPYIPRKISSTVFYIYLGSLTLVSLFFLNKAMSWEYLLLGVIWVSGFFLGTSYFTKRWSDIPEKKFKKNLFWIAVGLRIVWVSFSYIYYIAKTGIPFEFNAADSIYYYEESLWLYREPIRNIWKYLVLDKTSVSDSGYLMYLAIIQKVVGPYIIMVRLTKTLISAFTCLLLYKLAKRTFSEEVGRMAGVFAMLFPNLIFYCGLHLKETEMLFLMVAFLERSDYLLRERHFNVLNVGIVLLLAVSLFFFRTVLGAVAVFSFVTSLVFTTSRIIGKAKRVMLIGWAVLAIGVLAGGTIATEVEGIWSDRAENQTTKRDYQVSKGVTWAKYATGSVMAPMMFILPLPTMVDVDNQYTQQMLSGGNFSKDMLAGFVLIAIYSAVFVRKNWRDLSLLGAFEIGYLGVICLSGFANAERFLLPGVPLILVFAAYGLSILDGKSYRFLKIWYWVVPVICVGWAIFKIGARGLL